MAELVDAYASGAYESNLVRVRVPLAAQTVEYCLQDEKDGADEVQT